MRYYIDIDPIPANEDFPSKATNFEQRQLARVYREQLKREFPAWEGLVSFRIVSCGHDLGDYTQIRIVFDDDNQEAAELAYRIESESSLVWDQEARLELGLDRILKI